MRIKKLFYLLFFILVFALIFIWNKNSFSKSKLRLEIFGPEKVAVGEKASFLVKYKNNSNAILKEARLYFQCPSDSYLESGERMEEKELEDIYPGQEKSFNFQCILWGREKEIKEVESWVVFRPKNLKSKFEVKNSFHFEITRSLLNFEIDMPSKVEKDKVFLFNIYYFSNSQEPLSQIKIKANFPNDFQLISSSLPFSEENVWTINDLGPEAGGKIEIQGILKGAVGEMRNFSFSLFYEKDKKSILLRELTKKVMIEKTNLFLRQEINGSPNFVASLGDVLHYEIYFKNIGNQPLEKLSLICILEGDAFNFDDLKTLTGYFRKGDNSVVFDWKTNPSLAFLEPMEEGKIEFWVTLKKENVKNPILKNKVFIGSSKEEFETKILSPIQISQVGYYHDEVFGNTGPLPPRVGEQTTFTIGWLIKNPLNEISNVKVRAKLGENVKLSLSNIFPETESSRFFYDSEKGEIFWSLDKLESNQEKTVYFQVIFSPKLDQRGKMPSLISEITLEGYDLFTKENIFLQGNSLTTMLEQGERLEESLSRVQ
jgi:hypothetical protein